MARFSFVVWCSLIIALYMVQNIEASNEVKFLAPCGYKSLAFTSRRRSAFNSSTVVTCVECQECPPGLGIHVHCGTTYRHEEKVIILKRNKCKFCLKGTFSPSYSRGPCRTCTICEHGSTVLRNCTPTQDSQCGPCKKGYYRDTVLDSCLQCSSCCGNEKDEVIEECVKQEPRSNKQCSLFTRRRCLKWRSISASKYISLFHYREAILLTWKKNIYVPTMTFHRESEKGFAPLLTIGVCCVTLAFLIIVRIRKHLQCSPRMTSTIKEDSYECRSVQIDEQEDWSNNDFSNCTYSFRCGALVKYEPHSKQDRFKNLIVEALSEQAFNSYSSSTKKTKITLSPIYRFYTQGENFENKVKISLPHSAACRPDQKTWDIEILCMDERKGKDAKWEKISDSSEVNWKDASFYTDTLLTYGVVGKPLKGAKKRMQLVLFSKSEMISDLFEVGIHLLDDNKTSFQNVLKENSLKGFAMLGSFYAVFVDCFDSVDINVNIEGLLDGWELDHLKPKTISSSDCKESYFSIPCFQAAFRRVKRNADKFSCKFRIDVAGNEIIIPAFTFVPEEEFCVVVDVHEQDYDASVLKEKKTPFKDLDYDTKYVLARLLDVSVKGQGTWRQLGRNFGLPEDEVEQFSVEYRTLEGSPSRALFDYLSVAQPNITVGEFVTCLEGLGREDAIALLYKHLKKKPLNTKI